MDCTAAAALLNVRLLLFANLYHPSNFALNAFITSSTARRYASLFIFTFSFIFIFED